MLIFRVTSARNPASGGTDQRENADGIFQGSVMLIKMGHVIASGAKLISDMSNRICSAGSIAETPCWPSL